MDVKSAFLNGVLKEEVYVKQLDGFMKKGEEHKTNLRLVEDFKRVMNSEFQMTDLGQMKYFLELEIDQNDARIFIHLKKPDLAYRVNMMACFNANPSKQHVVYLKRTLRYVKHTINLIIWFERGGNSELLMFSDASYAGLKEAIVLEVVSSL
ncbi:uncharacterized protein [Rutidosis leptorrhynchoides]|uniref:uncharacterized protein n=1 Tax=Rutidosis leptorrhynchoides TaxID=125765 RepID=UPI003A997083